MYRCVSMCVLCYLEYSCKSRISLGSYLDSSKASSPGQLTSTHSNTQYTQYTHGSHGSHAGGGECDKPRKRIHVVVDTKGEFGGDEHNDRPFKAKPFIVRVHFEEELDVVLNQF